MRISSGEAPLMMAIEDLKSLAFRQQQVTTASVNNAVCRMSRRQARFLQAGTVEAKFNKGLRMAKKKVIQHTYQVKRVSSLSVKAKKAALNGQPAASDDREFQAFIVEDQLAGLDVVAKRMFGGYGLYAAERFFGIIHNGCLYFKTNERTRKRYTEIGMSYFKPNNKQHIKSYYQVPADIIENKANLQEWAQEAAKV